MEVPTNYLNVLWIDLKYSCIYIIVGEITRTKPTC